MFGIVMFNVLDISNCHRLKNMSKVEVFIPVYYIVEQNVKIFYACIEHRPYFTHLPIDCKTWALEAQNDNSF